MSEEENNQPIPELSGLKKEMNPPPELQERIVSQLLKKGLLRRKSGFRISKLIFATAAAIAIFALGFATAQIFRNSSVPVQYTYLLLLREDSAFLADRTHERSLVKEYSEWARGIAKSGTKITGEKLAPESRLLKNQFGQIQKSMSDPNGDIAGFFLLKASTDQEALQKARGCPHLRHGGTIELRRIDLSAEN